MAQKKHAPITAPGRIAQLFAGAVKWNLLKKNAPCVESAKAWIEQLIREAELPDTTRAKLLADLAALTYEAPKTAPVAPPPPKPMLTLELLQEAFRAEGDTLIRAEYHLREIRYANLLPVDSQPLVDFVRGQVETYFRKGAKDLRAIDEANKEADSWMEYRLPRPATSARPRRAA